MRRSEITEKRYCLESAAKSYEEAMRTDHPTWAPRAAVKLGPVHEVLGNQTDALAAYRYAMESHHPDWGPEGAFKLALLGSTSDIVGDTENLAAARFSINSEHTNWAPKAMTLLGRMLEKKGDFEGARAAYERALESRAEDTAATAAIYLGWLLERRPSSAPR
jgi:predicted negative regulator of RcsB-dependent stress response